MDNTVIGWKEWCGLPGLSLPLIEAKIDTGAATSCLHSFDIKEFKENGQRWIKFSIHPIHANFNLVQECRAPIYDQRIVSDSGGNKTLRYVIKTLFTLGEFKYEIEITLFNRENMAYGMLVGREALRNSFLVDSSKQYLIGKINKKLLREFYNIQI